MILLKFKSSFACVLKASGNSFEFMLIRWFFIYFADFWVSFCDFLTIIFFPSLDSY